MWIMLKIHYVGHVVIEVVLLLVAQGLQCLHPEELII